MSATTLQDRDLNDFLKRVENYDSMHFKDNDTPGTKLPFKEKPEQLKSSFSKESLERARKLLEGEQLVGVEKYNSNGTTGRIPTSDLAYKSAYNYDKTFSPEKSKCPEEKLGLENFGDSSIGTKNLKTFVISEEDYKLLQQLKSDVHSRERNPEEISTRHLPSRGRPRQERNDELQIEERPPSLPTRRSHTLSILELKDATQEKNVNGSKSPPLKPVRNGRLGRQDGRISSQMEKQKSSAPPPVPPKRQRPQASVTQLQPQKPVLDTEPKTYLSSLENNKLTVFDKHVSRTSQTIKQPSHIDYLDSVQMKHPTSFTSVSSSGKNVVKLPSSASEVNHSESFIKSALKTMETSPSLNPTQHSKPSLPAKPPNLRKSTSGDFANLDQQEPAHIGRTPVNELASVKLRTFEKSKPKVPVKKKDLIIPKLREVRSASIEKKTDSASLDDEKKTGKYERMGKLKTPLQGRKKESTTPEALLKFKKLNKTVSDDNCLDDKPIVEALAKLEKLQRVKDAPPVPQRKISMPEALKKAEALRNRQPRPPVKKIDEFSMTTELETILIAPRLSAQQSRENATLKSEIETSSALERPIGRMSKPSSEVENGIPKALKHLNKGRARGPKRKLPTKVHSA